MPDRYFHNNLDEDAEVPDSLLEGILEQTVSEVSRNLSNGIAGPSLYVGAAGIAWACWQAVQALQPAQAAAVAPASSSPASLQYAPPTPPPAQEARTRVVARLEQLAAEQATAAVDAVTEAGALRSSTAAALLDGAAGVYLTGVLVFRHAGRVHPASRTHASGSTGAARCLATYLSLLPKTLSGKSDELLYGRAGYLLGAAILQSKLKTPPELPESPPAGRPGSPAAATPHQALQQVSAAILESGRAQAAALDWPGLDPSVPKPPLWFQWHGERSTPPACLSVGACSVQRSPLQEQL